MTAAEVISATQQYLRRIGKQLVETALHALKEQNITKVNLVVFARNEDGNAFREALGFTELNGIDAVQVFSLSALVLRG